MKKTLLSCSMAVIISAVISISVLSGCKGKTDGGGVVIASTERVEYPTETSMRFINLDRDYDFYGPLEIWGISNRKIEFMDSVMPMDAQICIPAAFTKESFTEFTPNLVGNKYKTRGLKKQGYDCPISQTGCFAFYPDGTFYLGANNDKARYDKAQEYFEQNLILKDGEINLPKAISHDSRMHLRAFAEKDGKLYIVQTFEMIPYDSFIKRLQDAGFQNALYLDMGAWDFGYFKYDGKYYDFNPQINRAHERIDSLIPDRKQTNWIAVY